MLEFGPGQITSWGRRLAEPQGRLHFAGAEASDLPRGKKATSVAANFGSHTTTWSYRDGGYVNVNSYAAEGDEFVRDARALAERARRHGVYASLDVYPVEAHSFHVFWSFLPEAADALEAAGAFAREIWQAATQEDAAPAPER